MKATANAREFTFELTGGALCLDFANTVDNRPDQLRRTDHLGSCLDLIAWCRQTRILDSREAEELKRLSGQFPNRARSVLKRGKKLREAIFGIFSRVAARKSVAQAELDGLHVFVCRAMAHSCVRSQDRGFNWSWTWSDDEALERLLWPIAMSAAELLTSENLSSLRECAAENCAWLFLDNSRNQTRRWCDMKVCGNRAKVRRHYERTRGKTRRT